MIITDNYAKCMSAADRKSFDPPILLPAERIAKLEAQSEKELQVRVENWLTLHNFRRRTPEDIKRPGSCAGWFIHMHKAKCNPIILDLLILLPDNRYIEIELKTLTGDPSPEQSTLIKRGGRLCRTLEEFVKIIENKS